MVENRSDAGELAVGGAPASTITAAALERAAPAWSNPPRRAGSPPDLLLELAAGAAPGEELRRCRRLNGPPQSRRSAHLRSSNARFTHDQATRRARASRSTDRRKAARRARRGLAASSAAIELGVDRLIMLATGAETIDSVLTFAAGELRATMRGYEDRLVVDLDRVVGGM